MVATVNIIQMFEEHVIPSKGLPLFFRSSQALIRYLTERFSIVFGVVFDIQVHQHFLYSGTINGMEVPCNRTERKL